MKRLWILFTLILVLLVSSVVAMAGDIYCKKNTDQWFGFVLLDDTDYTTEKANALYNTIDIDFALMADTETLGAYSPDDATQFQHFGDGIYGVEMGASEFTSAGSRYVVRVAFTDSLSYRFIVNVLDDTIQEAHVNIDDIEEDTGTTIPGTITTAQTDLNTITGADGTTLATSQGNYAPNKVVPDAATTAAGLHGTTDGLIGTAQSDLDTLTGADGATLASTQPANVWGEEHFQDDIYGFNLFEVVGIIGSKSAGYRKYTLDGSDWDLEYFALDDLTGVGTAVIDQEDVDADGQTTGIITLTP